MIFDAHMKVLSKNVITKYLTFNFYASEHLYSIPWFIATSPFKSTTVEHMLQGRIQDFHLGGGGKRLCKRRHITSAKIKSLSEGVQGPLKVPGSSRVY